MDKTCIINPATGRAVKIDSRLGKKLAKQETDKPRQDAAKILQAAVKRKTTKKPTPVPPKPTPSKPTPPKPTPSKPAPTPAKSAKKFDVDYIKRYAKYIISKTTLNALDKELKKAKNGKQVKEMYAKYMSGYNKSQYTLRKIIDNELTESESKDLLDKKSPTADQDVRNIYYSSYERPFYDLQQDYLFKYEEAAE